jgi:hypothetical protein
MPPPVTHVTRSCAQKKHDTRPRAPTRQSRLSLPTDRTRARTRTAVVSFASGQRDVRSATVASKTRHNRRGLEAEGCLGLRGHLRPLPPMGWMDFNGSARCGVNPRRSGTAAGKHQGVKFAAGENRQTHVPVSGNIGNGLDRLPHFFILASSKRTHLDLAQCRFRMRWGD